MKVVSGPLQCPVLCPGNLTRGNKEPSYHTLHDNQPPQMLPLECSRATLHFLLSYYSSASISTAYSSVSLAMSVCQDPNTHLFYFYFLFFWN